MVYFINLKDTGKFDTGQSYQTDAKVTSEEKAYGSNGVKGAALNLNVYDITLNEDVLVNDEVALQKKADDSSTKRFESGEIDMVGVTYNLWTIKMVFNTEDTESLKDYGRLMHMCETKGYKQMFFSSSATLTKAHILMYSQYGRREYDGESTKTMGGSSLPINVRITGKTVKQGTDLTKIDFTLKLLETS